MRSIFYSLIVMRIVQTSAYIMLFFLLLIDLKEPKRKRIGFAVISCAALILAYLGVIIFRGSIWAELLAVPVEILICLITILICSKDKWQVTAFIMFTQFNIYLAIRYVTRMLIPVDSGIMYEVPNFILRTFFYAALFIVIYKVVRPHFRKLVKNLDQEWNLIAFTAFSFWLLEFIIQYYPQIYWKEDGNRWQLVVSSYLLFVVVYWLLFKSSSAFLERYERQERENILTMQNKIWKEHIEAQKVAVNLARRDRHDLRHHYDTLLAMLESGKTEAVISYLNTQTEQTEYTALAGICEHLAANAILSRWAAGARMNAVKIELDASIPEKIPIDDVALVGVIANALENAVEGCLRCSENMTRYIKAKMAYSTHNGVGKFYMVVENACLMDIVFENGYPISQKKNGGTGTRSIAYTADRFNGMVEFTAENGVFTTRVLLHL
jgi:hypothetical protein